VIGSAAPGGAEGQLTRLAAGLTARGHDVTVYFLVHGGPLTKVLDDAGVPWHLFGAIRPESSKRAKLVELARFVREIRQTRPDVVYAWLPGVTWVALPAVAVFSRARRVAAFRGLVQTFEVRTPMRRRAFRWAVRNAHAVTANAPWLENEARSWGARPARVRFMANGVQLPSIGADVGIQPPTAVVLANFFAYKRHELVVRALAHVPETRVLFIGSGDLLEQTRNLAHELGVIDRTTFVDDCDDAAPYLRSAQFAIHPSSTEGMSNAILEELAHGLPVVATNVGATSLLIEDGTSGILVPAEDLDALTRGMSRLATSPDLRAAMSPGARAAAERFSWDAVFQQHEQLFATVARRQE